MRIFHEPTRREAKAIKGSEDTTPVFKCWKHGGGNLDKDCYKFTWIEDAADFLRTNRKSGIRLASNGNGPGQGSGILHRDLCIEHKDGRIEKL